MSVQCSRFLKEPALFRYFQTSFAFLLIRVGFKKKMGVLHWRNDRDRGKPNYVEKSLSQGRSAHHKSRTGWPGSNPGFRSDFHPVIPAPWTRTSSIPPQKKRTASPLQRPNGWCRLGQKLQSKKDACRLKKEPTGCPETSITANRSFVTSQKEDDLIYTAAESWNDTEPTHSASNRFSTVIYIQSNKIHKVF